MVKQDRRLASHFFRTHAKVSPQAFGATSVPLFTLITCLKTTANIPEEISSLICSSFFNPSNQNTGPIRLSTTRCPEFGNTMENPMNGFQNLIADICKCPIYREAVQPSSEVRPIQGSLYPVISAGPSTHSTKKWLEEFVWSWSRTGEDLNLFRHYFLVFQLPTANCQLDASGVNSSTSTAATTGGYNHAPTNFPGQADSFYNDTSNTPADKTQTIRNHYAPATAETGFTGRAEFFPRGTSNTPADKTILWNGYTPATATFPNNGFSREGDSSIPTHPMPS